MSWSTIPVQALASVCPLPMIGVDRAGRVQLWSPAAEALLGWLEREAVGELDTRRLFHHPEEAGRVLDRQLLRAAERVAWESPLLATLQTRTYTPVPARVFAQLIGEGTLLFVQDRRPELDFQQRTEEANRQVAGLEERLSGLSRTLQGAFTITQPLTAAMGNIEMLLVAPEEMPSRAVHRLERSYEQLEKVAAGVHAMSEASRRGPRGGGG